MVFDSSIGFGFNLGLFGLDAYIPMLSQVWVLNVIPFFVSIVSLVSLSKRIQTPKIHNILIAFLFFFYFMEFSS